MKKSWIVLFLSSFLILGGCSLFQKNRELPNAVTFLHINDHHSKLNPTNMTLQMNGVEAKTEVGGFSRVVAKIKELSQKNERTIKVHAGDALTGDLFFVLFDGKAEAEMMNEVCFDTFTLGNHEFDKGDNGLKKFLTYLKNGKCKTEIISSNVSPKVGKSPLTPKTRWDSFKPYTIKEVGGQKIGIIGLTAAVKTKESSNPDKTTMFEDEYTTVQKYIDDLTSKGINRIVLVSHISIENDLELIKKLKGVDVVIGGDSHTLLGKDLEKFGLSPEEEYPITIHDANGKTVCLAQAWEYSLLVGELKVAWDDNGDVIGCGGTPHLLTSDVPKDPSAEKILAKYSQKVDEMKGNMIATTSDDLCLVRIPGEKRSAICKPEQNAKHGSDISMLVAFGFRYQSKLADIAIQNGGGVRADIGKGKISIGDVYKVLPFGNTLVNLTMSGGEIHQVLEDAMDFALQPGGSTGAYPYTAGLRFKVNTKAPKGQRLTNLEVKTKSDKKWKPLDMKKMYVVVTNDYLSNGKDGYVTFGKIKDDGRIQPTYLDYAQAFLDYLKSVKKVKKLPYSEYSTQQFIQ